MGHVQLVCVVDDDESVRESLPDLLKELGFAACAFSSAEEFLASEFVATADCLLLDIAMPGMTGPELQRELRVRPATHPDHLHHRTDRREGAAWTCSRRARSNASSSRSSERH